MPRKRGPGKPGLGQTRLDLGAMSRWSGGGYGDGWGGGGYAGGSWGSQAWDGWGGGGGGAGWGGGGYGGPDGPDPGKGDGKGTGRQRRKRGVVDSDSEPEVNTKDGASLGLPAVPRMDDDDTRLATGYKSLGMEWKWGKPALRASHSDAA